MRLANRFRPQRVVNKTTKVNAKKRGKRIAATRELVKALEASN